MSLTDDLQLTDEPLNLSDIRILGEKTDLNTTVPDLFQKFNHSVDHF